MESNVPVFDHYTIAVNDLNASIAFYGGVLGLEIVSRPEFDFPGAWLTIGLNQQVHLIEDARMFEISSGSRGLHFAFAVTDIWAYRHHLLTSGITIQKEIKPRPDGVLQLFIKDPDGYWIEITEANFK